MRRHDARWTGGLPLALTVACGGSSVRLHGEDDGADPTDATASVGSGSEAGSVTGDPSARPPPQILGAPPIVARGGFLYVIVDEPISRLQVELDGEPLGEPFDHLHADVPGGLWIVPETLAIGPATLGVRSTEDSDAVDTQPIELVAARFVDIAVPTGLAQDHDVSGSPAECAESHTGLALGDYDGDAAPDLFVGHVGRGGQLHRNLGDRDGDGLPEFEDVTVAAGLDGIDAVAMATFVDLEGDGDLDLFVGRRGANRVFRNRLVPTGAAGYDDVTAELGLGVESQRTMGVAFGDYDGDDDLDLYVVNHAFCFPEQGSDIRAEDHLYRNDDGVFVERKEELQGPVLSSVGFSAAWIDVERDGDRDLLVINDAVGGTIGLPNALWRNDGPAADGEGWQFTDVSAASGVALPGANGMGLALGDVDGDGFVDFAFSDIGPNHLLLNQGDGTFEDVGVDAGIERRRLPWDRQSITWAPHLFDHDDDGDLDLYFSGGRIKGNAPIPDAFFDNLAQELGNIVFEDLTWASGLADPGHDKASALVDLDRDGRWELLTMTWDGPLRVYHNETESAVGRHWVDVELRGRGGNRDAIGAIVELVAGGRMQTCFHGPRPSLGGGGETACHFGLGDVATIESLRVIWPDGTIHDPTPPDVDRRVLVIHPDAG